MSDTRFRWLVLVAATTAQAGAAYAMQGLGVMGAYLQRESGLSAAQVGLLVSAGGIATIGGLLVAGKLLDRHSERLVLGLGVVLMSAALVAAAVSNSFIGLLCCLVVVGIGYSSTQPGGSKSIVAWFDPRQRGLAMGIRQAGLPLGGAIAAASMPMLIGHWGVAGAFVGSALVTAVGGLLFVAVYRQPGRPVQPRAAVNTPPMSLWDILRHARMRHAIYSGCALVSAQYGMLMFLMLYVADGYRLGLGAASSFLLVAQVAGVLGRIFLAAWSDRRAASRYGVVVVCLVATLAGLLCLVLFHGFASLPVLALLCAWLGFFGFGWYGPWVALVADVAPVEQVGSALGVAMAVNQVFIVVMPPTLGLLHDTSGSYALVWSALAVLLFLAWYAGQQRTPHQAG